MKNLRTKVVYMLNDIKEEVDQLNLHIEDYKEVENFQAAMKCKIEKEILESLIIGLNRVLNS